MASDNFQTLSPGFSDTNSPESLFAEESSRKRPFDSTFSEVGLGHIDSDLSAGNPSGFIINKPSMENFANHPDLAGQPDPNTPPMMMQPDPSANQLNFSDNFMFQNRTVRPDDDEEDAQSQSELSPPPSPGTFSPVSNIRGSDSLYQDTCLTLINQSEGLQLEDTAVDSTSLWSQSLFANADPEEGISRKVRKSTRISDASSSVVYEESEVGSIPDSQGGSDFTFMKFGQGIEVENVTPSGSDLTILDSDLSNITQYLPKKTTSNLPGKSLKGGAYRNIKKLKEPALNLNFPARSGKRELKILTQPEEQHRARYLTEGSRGAIKDRSQNGFPVLKLCGYEEPVKLQVFIGSDQGKIKPHGFYQACQVCGKNASTSMQKDIDGTTVIEMHLDPATGMTATVDCVGILKLRNADVEQRIGLARSKKKSTKARLVFRTNIPNPDGTYLTLQVASSPILCTQPQGAPEISKKSLKECSVEGGEELFIIGKNFSKGTRVIFREVKGDQDVWKQEADVDQDYFQQTHMIVTVPPYRDLSIQEPVLVLLEVHSSSRVSEACSLTYKPAALVVKKEDPVTAPHVASSIPMDMMENADDVTLSKSVSPVALEYNKMFVEAARKGAITSELLLQGPSLCQQTNLAQPPQKADPSQLQTILKQELSTPPSWVEQEAAVSPTPSTQKRTVQHLLTEGCKPAKNSSLERIMELLQPKSEQALDGNVQQMAVNSCISDVSMGLGAQQVVDHAHLDIAAQLRQQQEKEQQESTTLQLQQLQQAQGISLPADQYTPKTPRTPHTPQNFTSPPPEMVLQERQDLPTPEVDLGGLMSELGKLQEETNQPAEQDFGQNLHSDPFPDNLSPEQGYQGSPQLNQSFTGSDYEQQVQQEEPLQADPRFSGSEQFQAQVPEASQSVNDTYRQSEETQIQQSNESCQPSNTAQYPVMSSSQAMEIDSGPRPTESVLKSLLTSGPNPGASMNSNTFSVQPPNREIESEQQRVMKAQNDLLDDLVKYLQNDTTDQGNMIDDIINSDAAAAKQATQNRSPSAPFEETRLERRELSMETLCSDEPSLPSSKPVAPNAGCSAVASNGEHVASSQYQMFGSTPNNTQLPGGINADLFQLPSSIAQPQNLQMSNGFSSSTSAALSMSTCVNMPGTESSAQGVGSWANSGHLSTSMSQSKPLTVDDFISTTLLQTVVKNSNSTPIMVSDIVQTGLGQQHTSEQQQQQQHLQQQQLEQRKQELHEQQILQQQQHQLQLEQQKQKQLQEQREQQLLQHQQKLQQHQQQEQQILQQQQQQLEKQKQQQAHQQPTQMAELLKLIGESSTTSNTNNGKTFQAVATTGPQGQPIIQLIPSSQVQLTGQKVVQVPDLAQKPVSNDLAALLMQKTSTSPPAQATSPVFTQNQPIMASSSNQAAKTSMTQSVFLMKDAKGRDILAQMPAQSSHGAVRTILLNLPACSPTAQPQVPGDTGSSSTLNQQQAQVQVNTTSTQMGANAGQHTLPPGTVLNVLPTATGNVGQQYTIITDEQKRLEQNEFVPILPIGGGCQSSGAGPQECYEAGHRALPVNDGCPSATDRSECTPLPDLNFMDVDHLLNQDQGTR